MLDSKASRWRFWLLWTVASAVGGAAVTTLTRAAVSTMGYAGDGSVDGPHLGGVVGDEAVLAVALCAFMAGIGTAQWLVISRRLPWAGAWLLGSVVGGIAAGALIYGVTTALGGFGVPRASNTGLVTGLTALGTAHWLALRGRVVGAHWLALGAVAGLFGAAVGGGVLGALVGVPIGAGSGFGAGFGAVSGAAVVWVGSRAAPSVP